ncbi:CHASE4 domain-containing protein [Magnetococcus sp. PR-3]|uniref:CHASE4 domain-containing protein n=1 Tax=Magnetococcus sp. PR-3 TaxID=3120355 RepID=UPI002FCE57B9
MSLQPRIIWILFSVGVAYLLLSLMLQSLFITPRFIELEQQQVQTGLERVKGMFEDEKRHLNSMTHNWASWDEPYAYVLDQNPQFVTNNLGPDLMVSGKVHAFGIYNLKGARIWGGKLSADQKQVEPWSLFPKQTSTDHPFISRDAHAKPLSGFRIHNQQIWLISAYPILPTNEEGPSHGTMIMARKLDQALQQRWQEKAKISFHLIFAEQLPEKIDQAEKVFQTLLQTPGFWINPASQTQIDGLMILRNIQQQPKLIIHTQSPRTLVQQATENMLWFNMLMAIGTVVMILTVIQFLRHVVIKPIKQLQNSMHQFTENAQQWRPSQPRGNGEITQLTSNFNHMGKELRENNQLLIHARDQALAASQAKNLFLATMSHEIRTPLNGIIGLLSIMQDKEPNGSLHKELSIMAKSADLLLRLISDVLDFSKIEAGQLTLEQIPYSPRQVLQDVMELFTPQAQQKKIQLVSAIAPDLPAAVHGDPTRIRQVLINLVGNAIKFTTSGTVTLGLHAQESAPEDRLELRFSVKDTGLGIPPDKLTDLFSPFVQANNAISRTHGGSGLGLAITHRLAEIMGGKLEVTSTEGVGSCFTCLLATTLCATPLPEPPAPTTAAQMRPLKVMLVEDDDINQLVEATLLRSAHHEVTIVAHGLEAVTLFEKDAHWDVILMDIRMPVMDGLEATQRIRASETTHTPIIGLTADVVNDMMIKAREIGMDHVLTKPVRVEDLHQALDTYAAAPPTT